MATADGRFRGCGFSTPYLNRFRVKSHARMCGPIQLPIAFVRFSCSSRWGRRQVPSRGSGKPGKLRRRRVATNMIVVARVPRPVILVWRRGSLSLPPRISRTRLMILSARRLGVRARARRTPPQRSWAAAGGVSPAPISDAARAARPWECLPHGRRLHFESASQGALRAGSQAAHTAQWPAYCSHAQLARS